MDNVLLEERGKGADQKKWRSHWSKSNSLQFPAAAVQFHRRPERKCTMGKSLAKVFQSDFYCFLEERGTLNIFQIQQKWDEWKPFLVHSWIASFWTNIWLVWKAISSWKALRGFDLKIPAWGEAEGQKQGIWASRDLVVSKPFNGDRRLWSLWSSTNENQYTKYFRFIWGQKRSFKDTVLGPGGT